MPKTILKNLDELNVVETYDYKYTDKVIRYMVRRFMDVFDGVMGVMMYMTDKEIISHSHKVYQELNEIAESGLLKVARHYGNDIDKDWVEEFLLEYNPVTKYVYRHEVDRKDSRFAESIISSRDNMKPEIETGLKYWVKMINQYAVDITDKSVVDKYKSQGVEQVVWITVKDERRCSECAERHGVVYDIDDVPPKPHWNCRCVLAPYRQGSRKNAE